MRSLGTQLLLASHIIKEISMECTTKQIMQLNGSSEEFEMLSSILNRLSAIKAGTAVKVTLSQSDLEFARGVMQEIDDQT